MCCFVTGYVFSAVSKKKNIAITFKTSVVSEP